MKQTLLFAIIIFLLPRLSAQYSGDIYSLSLGTNKCIYKFSAKSNSLVLLDTITHEIAIKYGPHDTVSATDPGTGKTETKYVVNDGIEYHFEASMTYSELIGFLKNGLVLKGNSGDLKISTYSIYYESAMGGAILPVKYPETIENILPKIQSLSKGGFVLIHPKGADQDRRGMYAGGAFLALIRIK